MGDFLSRMAERALDRSQELRPDLAPTFAFASARDYTPAEPARAAQAESPAPGAMISMRDAHRVDLRAATSELPHSTETMTARAQPEFRRPAERRASFQSLEV